MYVYVYIYYIKSLFLTENPDTVDCSGIIFFKEGFHVFTSNTYDE